MPYAPLKLLRSNLATMLVPSVLAWLKAFVIHIATPHVATVSPTMQIGRRRRAHQELRPDAKVISLGIGDTTQPIPEVVGKAMADAATGLTTTDGYSG